MPYKDPARGKQNKRDYYLKNRDRVKAAVRVYGYAKRVENKLLVLTRYGKNGQLNCCWPDCGITDVDMLSIDHIENNGAHHRKNMTGDPGYGAGAPFYARLIRENFPDGYQTLCLNHQFKKELLRKRERYNRFHSTDNGQQGQ